MLLMDFQTIYNMVLVFLLLLPIPVLVYHVLASEEEGEELEQENV